jgi:glycosyltransferase involved in cell wall biosynthesis
MTIDNRVGLDDARVAIVHDWLTVYGGAERVLEQMLEVFPGADLYCVCDFVPASAREFLLGKVPRTSFIQRLPGVRARYRSYLPLMPLAIEQLDVSAYDIVLSSSHAVAKGVLTGPDQLHVSYVHSPMRYAWDLQHQYLREAGLDKGPKGWLARWMLHRMRMWDSRTANGVDVFLANSRFIARRIRKTYRREAEVLYPPVDLDRFALRHVKEDFYVTASRLVPYKRVDAIVQAFTRIPQRRLKVVGEGPELAKIENLARGAPNIELLGYRPAAELVEFMGRARAFVFAAEEDFGIVPLEAQACGTPVIAFGKGGVLETVRGLGRVGGEATGLFFDSQAPESIVRAVEEFEEAGPVFDPAACRAQAQLFSIQRFRKEFRALVATAWNEFSAAREA